MKHLCIKYDQIILALPKLTTDIKMLCIVVKSVAKALLYGVLSCCQKVAGVF